MRCPKCKTDVPDGHSYCTKCRTLLHDYAPEDAEPTETTVSRAGKRFFDLLILVVLIAGGIVLGRAIQWKQVLTGFKPTAAASPSPKQGRSQNSAPAKHKSARSSSQTPQEKSVEPARPASAESKSEKPAPPSAADEDRPAPKPDLMKKKDGQ